MAVVWLGDDVRVMIGLCAHLQLYFLMVRKLNIYKSTDLPDPLFCGDGGGVVRR